MQFEEVIFKETAVEMLRGVKLFWFSSRELWGRVLLRRKTSGGEGDYESALCAIRTVTKGLLRLVDSFGMVIPAGIDSSRVNQAFSCFVLISLFFGVHI